MKGVISFVIFVRTLHIFAFSIEPHNFTCPLQAHWKFLAYEKCNSTLKYFCLYNNVEEKYVEGCKGPDWDRKGSKRIYVGDFSRGYCIPERFQPFKFWTNGSMSDCIYSKSICSEDGQIVYIDNSAKDDRTCRCDYRRNYTFVKTPRHLCYCIPTQEDCSCYIKACPENYTLSADYRCISSSYQEKPKCISITRYTEKEDENMQVDMNKDNSLLNNISTKTRWKDTPAALMLFSLCLVFIFVVGTFFVAVLFHEWTIKRILPLNRYFHKKRTGTTWFIEILPKSERSQTVIATAKDLADGIVQGNHLDSSSRTLDDKSQRNGSFQVTNGQLDVDLHRPLKLAKITTDEANYLRIIHLLFRVACPIVRMTFNHEIQPNQLRKTLDGKKAELDKKYRKKKKIINNFQWDFLYGSVPGKKITSECFDIRLMIYLLDTLAKIGVGDLYPVPSDKRVNAMLSRIKYIRNEATQNFEGKLVDAQFNKYWDDIAQAVLKLVSSHRIPDGQETNQLISRLHTLNPMDLDNDKLCKYIGMSEIYPAKILQKLIAEYCSLNNIGIEEILENEKHDLYHKRIKTESCCACSASDVQFCTYVKVIHEKQWEVLYEIKKCTDSHSCPYNLTKCSERFVPKMIDTCDLSVIVLLVLYIPDILSHIINRLYKNEFDTFLMNNKHALYHSMGKEKCCKCIKDSTDKISLNKKDWKKLFRKEDNKESHTTCREDCCCKYSVITGIKSSDMEETLLSKICHVAGPISLLNKIGQAPFSYFLNWIVDEQPLQGAITELLKVIEDETFQNDMSQRIASCKWDDNIKPGASGWLSKQLQNYKATETPDQVFVFDKDSASVKSVQIPKDLSLPNRTRSFKNFSDEENNFLVVFHGLTQIVYPVIKDLFNKQCLDDCLDTIRRDIYDQQHGEQNKDEIRSKKIYLTQKQQVNFFSPHKEEAKNLDLKLMIYILKRKTEEEGKKDNVDQLNEIDNIRRELTKSSNGVICEKRFEEILELLTKALVHFKGDKYDGKISDLRNIKIF